jgi:hypothetical protein
MFRGAMIMHKPVQVGEIRTPAAKAAASEKKSGGLFSMFKKSKKPDDYTGENYESLTSALSAKAPVEQDDVEFIELYHIKGNTPMTGIAIQIDLDASELNSVDYFILSCPEVCYIRYPAVAVEEDKNMAFSIATFLSLRPRGVSPKTVEGFNEGKEPEYFWVALGGKKPYAPGFKEFPSSVPVKDPVLYLATSQDSLLIIKRVRFIIE